jgi:hypothetical protein
MINKTVYYYYTNKGTELSMKHSMHIISFENEWYRCGITEGSRMA